MRIKTVERQTVVFLTQI